MVEGSRKLLFQGHCLIQTLDFCAKIMNSEGRLKNEGKFSMKEEGRLKISGFSNDLGVGAHQEVHKDSSRQGLVTLAGRGPPSGNLVDGLPLATVRSTRWLASQVGPDINVFFRAEIENKLSFDHQKLIFT